MATQEQIQAQGEHLASVVQTLAGVGMLLSLMVPEIAKHVGTDEAQAVQHFNQDVFLPIVKSIDRQVDQLIADYQAAATEVSDLEKLLKQP